MKWLACFAPQALHDENSHAADAFRYGAVVTREGFSFHGNQKAEIVPQQEEEFDRFKPITTV